jgi:O-antigen/teichoic acid export membrane protein
LLIAERSGGKNMSAVQRSIVFSAVERYASVSLFVITTAILSRLLTPAEFGTFAVVSALTTVVSVSFQEFGGANYLIQKQELSRRHIRTAFTIIFAISIMIGALFFVLSGVLSRFMGQDSLANGLSVSALSFLFVPFSGTIAALFRRDLTFGKLAICNLVANVAGAIVSILLAMLKFSYMAPIWGGFANCVTLTLILLAWHRDFGLFRPSLADYRDIVGFGIYSSGVSLINVFYNLAPQLFLAKLLDFAAVGLYSRAINLTQIFDRLVIQVLSPVIMPAVAAQRKSGADLKGVYLEAIQLLSVMQWPCLTFIAIMAHPIIEIWLGPSWLEIVPLVRILCIANLAMFAACLSYPVLVAAGHVRDALVSSLISLPPSLCLLFAAAFFNVHAVAAVALLTLPFQAVVTIYFIQKRLDIDGGKIIEALQRSAVVTVSTALGAACCAVLIEVGTAKPIVGLVAGSSCAALCWWLGLVLTGHPMLNHLYHALSGVVDLVRPRFRRPLI